MQIVTVAGPPSVGKTSVIVRTARLLQEQSRKVGGVKFDSLPTSDDQIYRRHGLNVVVGLSGNICPDHFLSAMAILQAALRVPDFQSLHPYQFILAQGDGLTRFGEMLQHAVIAAHRPPKQIARAPLMPLRAPLMVVVVSRPQQHPIVHRLEQQLTAGCAVMAMQMAAVAQGFSGVWRSGWPMFDRGLHQALELSDDDQIVGFLYLGTPITPPAPPKPIESAPFVRWL